MSAERPVFSKFKDTIKKPVEFARKNRYKITSFVIANGGIAIGGFHIATDGPSLPIEVALIGGGVLVDVLFVNLIVTERKLAESKAESKRIDAEIQAINAKIWANKIEMFKDIYHNS